jgi:hypothetical protein
MTRALASAIGSLCSSLRLSSSQARASAAISLSRRSFIGVPNNLLRVSSSVRSIFLMPAFRMISSTLSNSVAESTCVHVTGCGSKPAPTATTRSLSLSSSLAAWSSASERPASVCSM